MVCRARAILPVLAASAALAGCAEEGVTPEAAGPGCYRALTGAELRTIGSPGAPDLPFGEALVTYSEVVRLLHAYEGERVDGRIRWAVGQLAIILERMPGAAAEPALRRAAAEIHAQTAEAPSEGSAIEQNRLALTIAATALLDLAVSAYGRAPGVAARARAFGEAVSAIDPTLTPPDRLGEIGALRRAEDVLAAMYEANIAPPRP